MGNTLTDLIPTIYQAVDTVSRELVGFIPSVYRNATAAQAAKGETIRYPIVGAGAAIDIAPSATGPNPADETIGSGEMTISKSRARLFYITGEEEVGLGNSGQLEKITQDRFTQAMRALCNEIEADVAAQYAYASRAYGTAGTAPFASDLSDPAQVRKILADNGAPMNDGKLRLIIDTTAGAKLRTLAMLNKVSEAGSTDPLRRGVLLDLHGFTIRESAQVKLHAKGTGASYVTNLAEALAAGARDVAVDTGSGTILLGDIVVFEGDTNKYVVSEALSGGTLSIAKPGLRASLADGKTVTVGNSYTANLAFHEDSIHLITRAPARPKSGDNAADVVTVQDPVSGLAFTVALYKQYHRVAYEVGIAWGVQAVKPEHMAILLG